MPSFLMVCPFCIFNGHDTECLEKSRRAKIWGSNLYFDILPYW